MSGLPRAKTTEGKPSVQIAEWSMLLTQEADCCQPANDLAQTLRIECLDGGGGKYFVISTERWAFDSVQEFAEALLKAVNRVSGE